MVNANLPDEWLGNLAFDGLSDGAWRVFTGALMHSHRQGTNGAIHKRYIANLHPEGLGGKWLAELETAGIWEKTSEGVQLLSWSTKLRQSTAERVENNLETLRRAAAAQRERRKKGYAASSNYPPAPPPPSFKESSTPEPVTATVAPTVPPTIGASLAGDVVQLQVQLQLQASEATGAVLPSGNAKPGGWSTAPVPGEQSTLFAVPVIESQQGNYGSR